MPTYEFLNKETGQFEDHFMSYTKLDEFKKNNPHLLQQISAPNIVGGYNDRVKTDGGFKDVLHKISDAHPHSDLADRYGKKTAKQAKSKAALDKIKKKYGKITE